VTIFFLLKLVIIQEFSYSEKNLKLVIILVNTLLICIFVILVCIWSLTFFWIVFGFYWSLFRF